MPDLSQKSSPPHVLAFSKPPAAIDSADRQRIAKRLNQRLDQLDVQQLQIVELVVLAIMRGAVGGVR